MASIKDVAEQLGIQPKTATTGNSLKSVANQLGIQPATQQIQQPQPALQKQGFFSDLIGDIKETGKGIYEDLSRRGKQMSETLEAQKKGKQGLLSTGTQLFGRSLLAAGDIVGNLVIGAGKAALTEENEQKIANSMKKIISTPIGSEAVNKFNEGLESWEVWKSESDRNAKWGRNIESILGVAEWVPLGKGLKMGSGVVGDIAGGAGKVIRESGEQAIEKTKKSFIRDLVSEVKTKKVTEANVPKSYETGRGLLKKTIIQPTKREIEMENVISDLVNVNPKATNQRNFNLIADKNKQLAQELKRDIGDSGGTWSINNLKGAINDVEVPIGARSIDGSKQVKDIKNYVLTLANESPKNAKGAFEMSQRFRSNINDVFGEKIWGKDTPIANYVRSINRQLNDFTKSLLPKGKTKSGISFEESMRRQSLLFDAMDRIVPKAAKEADSIMGRLGQKAERALGTKNRAVQAFAALVGIGGLGAAATFAPIAAGLGISGFFIYRGGKLILNPKIRVALGKILQEIDRKLKYVKSDKETKLFKETKQAIKSFLNGKQPGLSIENVSKKKIGNLSDSIAKAKAEGKSFDEWVDMFPKTEKEYLELAKGGKINKATNSPAPYNLVKENDSLTYGINEGYSFNDIAYFYKARADKLGKGSGWESFKNNLDFNKSQLKQLWDSAGNEGFKNFDDLSIKTLGKLEGKRIVSKEYIQNLTNQPDLKQTEKDLIRNTLQTFDGRKIDVQEFAKRVKAELLSLERNSTGLKNWKNRPITDNGSTMRPRYESVVLPDELRGNVADYAENIYNSPIKTSVGSVHFGGNYKSEGYFGHTRIEDMADGKTRRVIENQTDLYQKGNLDRELSNISDDKVRFMQEQGFKADDILKDRKEQVAKLQQYSNPTAHFRMAREEIKQAAIDGKSKLQFPTGETAMKIEGLGDYTSWQNLRGETLLRDYPVKAGMELKQRGQSEKWIITKVLGDGRFKAMPREVYERMQKDFHSSKQSYRNLEEEFDISGKIDTNNPIYRFYEKDLAKYLKNRHNAKPVTDKNGVTWWEVPIDKKQKRLPVEAFGIGGLGIGASAYQQQQE